MRAFAGHAVEVRRLEEFRAVRVEAKKVVPVVVAQDEDNILERRLGCGCLPKREQRGGGQAKRLAKAGG